MIMVGTEGFSSWFIYQHILNLSSVDGDCRLFSRLLNQSGQPAFMHYT